MRGAAGDLMLDKEDFDWASRLEWFVDAGDGIIWRDRGHPDPEVFDGEVFDYALAFRIWGEHRWDMEVEHIDGNIWDYRRANLRFVQTPLRPVAKASEPFEQPDALRVLPLKQNQSAWCVLDKQDWDWAKHFQWRNIGKRVQREGAPAGQSRYLDLEIARRMFGKEEAADMYVEHIDGDPFNCRRVNLRLATAPTEKKANPRCAPGVCWWVKPKKQWVACVGHKYLRYFETLDEAIEAQKQAEQEDDAVAAPGAPAKRRKRI